ncbi:MAG: hypothetical protein A3A94_00625 [Candidatus Portnoybacteria bacterium RIFCSPLOWO2_01_FULL_43_11]|uniref:Type II secretion system protein J n=3 Tax=Candidatus Portnoyibacteriota TaxID=1817913 RepID=A0A1G2FAV7_9BACT|nr:MAG: hypothetical protein A2815_02215 [Candidatus Portnoybacteria bacterium RIFCSPHIGHO2_01_FULL_40_12b]OGZ36993.1 MAG: hypothetical protein A3D38_00745 [Candidatus Portnoybacteria bacterium RIFCSPHIGHO2_02_FULL_40_23]OGZ38350.1 MAG: hypothetical protein A3A94_00625 [Candidatus Portnoybacteria bacterium RIFCSPLOWO2_01_FULL_43_11]OGZ39600.1 MAG: hypothetical protein A3I20_00350 [Candidatus Portnoybacteria bacterium RIFCSPLOWO2_02_FULL_40_15]
MKSKFFSKGFTLLETIIYAVIFALISILVINMILMMTKSFSAFRVTRNINNSSEVAMERLVREIRWADDINAAESVFDSHPGKLVLNTIDPVTDLATTIEFFVSNGALMVREGISDAQPLISSKTEVTNFVFRQIIGSSVSKAVKVELELQSGQGDFQKKEKFYNSAILRRSY